MYIENITVAGIATEVRGTSVSEILEDIAAVFLFANRHKNSKEEMARAYTCFLPVYKAAVEINKLFGASVISSPITPEAREVQKQILEKIKAEEKTEGEERMTPLEVSTPADVLKSLPEE